MFAESFWADEVMIPRGHSVAKFVVSLVQYHLIQRTAVHYHVGDGSAAELWLG